jgi:GNAT superfamily N-acetyltransferase
MTARTVVPLDEQLLPAAVALAATGVRRSAAYLDSSSLAPPAGPVEKLIEPALRRYLDGEREGRRGWAVLDGDRLLAIAGTLAEELTPDDARYTFMPPRSVTIVSTALHAVSDAAAGECYPLLWGQARRLAETMGGARVFVNVLAGDTAGRALWRRLGMRPGSVMARRPVQTWQAPAPPPSSVVVRVARPDDVEALTDLALEEHRYHAEYTSSGASPDQPRATSRRIAAESVAAPADGHRQLVAEDRSGRIVGSIAGSVQEWADDQIQRLLLPPRYGYVGLTVVSEPARGTGVGRALIDALMGWFADRRLDTAFLHYIADNPLSSRFWPRAGFVPHIEIYSGAEGG